jgi:hypothetical protein
MPRPAARAAQRRHQPRRCRATRALAALLMFARFSCLGQVRAVCGRALVHAVPVAQQHVAVPVRIVQVHLRALYKHVPAHPARRAPLWRPAPQAWPRGRRRPARHHFRLFSHICLFIKVETRIGSSTVCVCSTPTSPALGAGQRGGTQDPEAEQGCAGQARLRLHAPHGAPCGCCHRQSSHAARARTHAHRAACAGHTNGRVRGL